MGLVRSRIATEGYNSCFKFFDLPKSVEGFDGGNNDLYFADTTQRLGERESKERGAPKYCLNHG